MKRNNLIWLIPIIIISYLSWMMYLYILGHKTKYDSGYTDWYKYNYNVTDKSNHHFASVPVKEDKSLPFAKFNYKIINKSKPRFASLPAKDKKTLPPFARFNYKLVNKAKPRLASLSTNKDNAVPLVLKKETGITMQNMTNRTLAKSKLAGTATKINDIKVDTARIRKLQKNNTQLPDLANQQPETTIQADNNGKLTVITAKSIKNVEITEVPVNQFMITELRKSDEDKVIIIAGQSFAAESMSKVANAITKQGISTIDFQVGDQTNSLYSFNVLSKDKYVASNQLISSLAANINNGPMRATGSGTQDGFDAGTGAVDNGGKYNDSAGSGGSLGSLPLPDGNILMILFGMLYASLKNILKIKLIKSKSE